MRASTQPEDCRFIGQCTLDSRRGWFVPKQVISTAKAADLCEKLHAAE